MKPFGNMSRQHVNAKALQIGPADTAMLRQIIEEAETGEQFFSLLLFAGPVILPGQCFAIAKAPPRRRRPQKDRSNCTIAELELELAALEDENDSLFAALDEIRDIQQEVIADFGTRPKNR